MKSFSKYCFPKDGAAVLFRRETKLRDYVLLTAVVWVRDAAGGSRDAKTRVFGVVWEAESKVLVRMP